MKLAIGLVALAMGADLLTFALVVPLLGADAEVNPVMRRAYAQVGLVAVVLFKTLCTATIVLLVLRVKRPALRPLAAGIGVGLGALGTVANVTAGLVR